MKIRLFVPPILFSIYERLFSSTKKTYVIGNYSVEIPPKYALPHFQKTYRLYDRFLPLLVKQINSKKCIIDIGANIGDTTIAMVQQCDNPIISIEPSDFFYSYLEKNLCKLPHTISSRIKILKQLVGTGTISGDLNHTKGGTAGVTISDTNSSHIPLDTLIQQHDEIILLKIDTDGFDFDVINSATSIIAKSKPILFWENYITENFQMEGYNSMYQLLAQNGYNYLYIFDNFGNLMFEETNFTTLTNLNSYLFNMEKNNCTRTFSYTDILATTELYQPIAFKTIQEYKLKWINQNNSHL